MGNLSLSTARFDIHSILHCYTQNNIARILLALLLSISNCFADDVSQIKNIDIKQKSGRTLIIIDADIPFEFEYFNLDNPSRNVVDIAGIRNSDILFDTFKGTIIKGKDPCVNNVKLKSLKDNKFRLMFSVKQGLLSSAYQAKSSKEGQFRVVIDIYPENSSGIVCEGLIASTTIENDYAIQSGFDKSEIKQITDIGDTVFLSLKDKKKSPKKPSKQKYFDVSGYAMYTFVTNYTEGQASPEQLLEFKETSELRRAKINAGGNIYDFSYVLGLNLADWIDGKDKIKLYRAYIRYSGISWLHMSAGLQPEPFGLEKTTSSKYTQFIERSLTSAFSPEDNLGILFASNMYKNLDVQIGAYKERSYPEGGQTERSYSSRITFAPLLTSNSLIHLGASYSYRNPLDNKVRYRARPEAHLANRLFDSGKLRDVETVVLTGAEIAFLVGSFSLQSEFVSSNVEIPAQSKQLNYSAAYISASWFLTGENRSYSHGVFGRIKPKRSILKKNGWGAVQLAARASYIKDQKEQELRDYTVGVNWLLTKRNRIMFNWIFTQYTNKDYLDDGDIFMTQIQLGF